MPLLLSDEQKAALDGAGGRPVEAVHEPSGARYLIVADSESVWAEMSESERTAWLTAASESFGRAGWDDPIMDEYNNYDESYRKRFGHDPR